VWLCDDALQVQRTAEDQNVDVDNSDDEFEEYEWAGQTRVRASSMLLRDSPGKYMIDIRVLCIKCIGKILHRCSCITPMCIMMLLLRMLPLFVFK